MKFLKSKKMLSILMIIASNVIVVNAYEKTDFDIDNQNYGSSYEYKVGEKLANFLLQNCSLFAVTVENIKEEKLTINTQEILWGKAIDNKKLQLDSSNFFIDVGLDPKAYSDEIYKKTTAGDRLIMSSCKSEVGIQRYVMVLSKEELFPAIRQVISYHLRYKQNSSVLLEVPHLIDDSDKLVFAGYIVSILRSSWIYDRENTALVLSQLLETSKLPTFAFGHIRIALRRLLIKEDEDALSLETRNFIIAKLVEIGSSDKKSAEQVIILFLEVAAQNDNLDIKPFLNEKKRRGLLQNYQNYIAKNNSQNGRKEFEKQLNSKP